MKINKQLFSKLFNKWNLKLEKISEVSTGKFNQTYIAQINENFNTINDININKQKVVLRIAPPANSDFIFYEKNMMQREPKIHQIINNKTKIPIPKIYVFDNSQEIINRNYLLMEYIEGKPLSQTSVSSFKKEKIMKSTGRLLKELHHNCQNDLFGYPANHCMEQKKDWWSAFKEMWNKLITDLEKREIYNSSQAKKAREVLIKYRDLFPEQTSSTLLHMDIWEQNILINQKGEITGIVDWDRALWGDPEIEFAVLDYCGFNNSSFWEGYGSKPEKSPEFKIRSQFYHLYEVQKYPVIWYKRSPKPQQLENYKKYSLNLIETLNSNR